MDEGIDVEYFLVYKNSKNKIKRFPNVPIIAAQLLIGLDKGKYAKHYIPGIPLIEPDIYAEERRLQPKDAVEELKKLNDPSLQTPIKTLEKSTDILVIKERRDYRKMVGYVGH